MISDQVNLISNLIIFYWRITYKGESKAHVNDSAEEEVVRNGGDGGGWSGEATQKETTVFYHVLLVFSD